MIFRDSLHFGLLAGRETYALVFHVISIMQDTKYDIYTYRLHGSKQMAVMGLLAPQILRALFLFSDRHFFHGVLGQESDLLKTRTSAIINFP